MRRLRFLGVLSACVCAVYACSNSVDLGAAASDSSVPIDMPDAGVDADASMGADANMDAAFDAPVDVDMVIAEDMTDATMHPVGSWHDYLLVDSPSNLDFDVAMDSTGAMQVATPSGSTVIHYEIDLVASPTTFAIATGVDAAEQLAIAADEDNNLHVAFIDDNVGKVVYAKRTGMSWTLETLDGTATSIEAVAIAASTTHGVAITYTRESTSHANLIWNQGSGWQNSEMLESSLSVQPSPVAFDSLGRAHFVANNGDSISHGSVASPGAEVASEPTTSISSYQSYKMLIDPSDDSVHVVVTDRYLGEDRMLYSNNRSGSWSTRSLLAPSSDGYAIDFGFAITSSGELGVLYETYDTHRLYYGRIAASGPLEAIELPRPSGSVYGNRLLYDPSDRPVVVHNDLIEMHVLAWHE